MYCNALQGQNITDENFALCNNDVEFYKLVNGSWIRNLMP